MDCNKCILLFLILLAIPCRAYDKGVANICPVFVWDASASTYLTGDADNISAIISRDGAAAVALSDATPTEIGNGVYVFSITAYEANADFFIVSATSSTANTVIDPVGISTIERSVGSGDAAVDADTVADDGNDLYYKTSSGAGIDGAIVRAYVASEYAVNGTKATLRGNTTTASDGSWVDPLQLNSGVTYTIWFWKQGVYGPDTQEVTP